MKSECESREYILSTQTHTGIQRHRQTRAECAIRAGAAGNRCQPRDHIDVQGCDRLGNYLFFIS